MSLRLSLLSLLMLALAGCATFDQNQLAQFRSRGVPPALVDKLSRNRPLTPPEVIVLSRRGVPAPELVRYIHRSGVNYLVTHADAVAMRKAAVAPSVIDALAEESSVFAGYYRRPAVSYGVGFGMYGDPYFGRSYYGDPYFDEPYYGVPGYRPRYW